ncbi:hypothetical protein FSP39_005106 [Pinctada imbricata]|uniref:DNA ligase n=1 Tax=Pinctada imbricata TaxID=66713 RepID=A0AA88YGQ1_PINIB|nr:hypothetical protein FSP39_005106 [Pinctada imbricata]
MKQWYHPACIFETLKRARATTKKIEEPDDLEGFGDLEKEDKAAIIKLIDDFTSEQSSKTPTKKKSPAKQAKLPFSPPSPKKAKDEDVPSTSAASEDAPVDQDDSFREFRRLCASIADESSYTGKTKIVKQFITKGSDGESFTGDLHLWLKLLLPGVVKRVYNLNNKQLVKLFSQIFGTDLDDMIEDLEQGDVAETIRIFFEQSKRLPPVKKSNLSIHQRNLQDIVDRVMEGRESSKPGMKKQLSVKASLMTPILPMLAEACRSVEYAMKKCPNGFYSEIKYDGERVQIHKKGDSYSYFSRSLKPVLPHKVQHFKEYIPKAFPTGDNLILDAEVLLVDTKTSKPLPFGTLGVHKKAAFKDACVCLFVFDCMHLNGENIMNKPIKERRKILEKEMTEIPNRIVFSELNHVTKPEDLQEQIDEVFSQGLEGLVLKDVKSVYEPGKRHWLKIKKDYLAEGTMADSADLSVLGAYYGSGRKGGIMSIFLLGVYNPDTKKWCTVTKCHSGLDDETLQKLQTSLDMVKISKDESKVPSWLNVKKAVVPDFVSKDPKLAPVWEISGAEFSKADIHTADGISIRFPRITKFRDDKSWDTATNLRELRELFKKSKEVSDVKPKAKNKNKNADVEKDGSDTDVNSDTDTEDKVATPTKSPKKTVAPSPKKKSSENGLTDDHKNGMGKKRSIDSDGEETSTPKKKVNIARIVLIEKFQYA